MRTKLLINTRLLNVLIERVHEDDLPITIDTGIHKDGLTEVLFEYPDSFSEAFNPLIDDVSNSIFGPLEESNNE